MVPRQNPSRSSDNFFNELKRSEDIKSLGHQIINIINRLGFSDYTFVPLVRDWEYEAQQGLLSTYPEDYWRIFQEERLYTQDVLTSFFKENNQPIFISQVYNYYCNAPFNTELAMISRAIRQLHVSVGFFESYVIPVMADNGKSKFLFSITQQNMDATDFQKKINSIGPELRSLGQAISKVCHSKFPLLFERPVPKVVHIAPKPLRVLATLANEDLTITEVASKLCISPITAHQHIAAARRALKRNTNIGAIKKAIKLGIIAYED